MAMPQAHTCPKCGFTADTGLIDCPRCGIIVAKFLKREREQKQLDRLAANEKNSVADQLAGATRLVVQQQKEWGEILTGIEAKNKYDVMDPRGHLMFQAEEQEGTLAAVLSRVLLKALRPFTMHLFTTAGRGVLTLKRPFRFYFHELEISKANGIPLGKIKRRFSVLRKNYSVLDQNGREIFQLYGPILHPWTFEIQKGAQVLGKITKKWSGLAKEAFTDADNFGIVFPNGIDFSQKAILLGAVFLIDFVHFENRGKNGSS
jgi:uncharacterized protein YxjI